MLKLFLCIAILGSPISADAPSYYIDRVEVHAAYGSAYILRLANQIVPPDKLTRKSDIDCLVKEIKTSGMFIEVRSKLLHEKKGTRRKLIVTAIPNPQLRNFSLSEITWVGSHEIDGRRFQAALSNNNITAGELLTKFSLNELMERVTNAWRETTQRGLETDDVEIPWIIIRPSGPNKVKLIVSPAYMGCEAVKELSTPTF